MISFSRSDKSRLARWWWTVDHWLLAAIGLLMFTGMLLIFAAGTPIALKKGLPSFHFAERQIVFLVLGVVAMIGISLLSVKGVRRFAVLLLPVTLILTLATLLFGPEINGAQRWLPVGIFTLQPSEFLKPAFIVVTAWMFSAQMENPEFHGRLIATVLYVVVAGLLVLQPDYGQAILISAVWLIQFAMAGLPMVWIVGYGGIGLAGLTAAYFLVPHFASRIDRHIDPTSGDTGQIEAAINSFRIGRLFGAGPGEGSVKNHLPDAHSDYIFAVAGEEFGAFFCLGILAIFAAIVIRGLSRLYEEQNPLVLLAGAGLLIQFGLQALINMGVNLAVLPSKGMTLPFISYGGSSMLALCIGMGMVLALTRKNRFLTIHYPPRRSFAS